MMAVGVSPGPALNPAKPQRLFEKAYEPSLALWPDYAVSPDSQRFLMVKTIEHEGTPAQINVVVGWFEELKRLAPPTGGEAFALTAHPPHQLRTSSLTCALACRIIRTS